MILPDVNVLIYTHRPSGDEQGKVAEWFAREVNSGKPFALTDVVVSAFLRVVTHPRIFVRPTPLATAVEFIDGLVERDECVQLSAGTRHWRLFRDVVVRADAKANLVPDAHLASIAMESGATLVTCDRGFSRYHGLNWLDPRSV